MVRAAWGVVEKAWISFSFASVQSMADGARDKGSRAADEPLAERLEHLGERLDRIAPGRPQGGPAPPPAGNASGFARGMRLSTELVAGVLVGAFLGWLI